MPRYARRVGPSVAFELTGVAQQVPGVEVTRNWDEGELLILARCVILNASGVRTGHAIKPTIDGVPTPQTPPQITLPAGDVGTVNEAMIVTVDAGTHTIGLVATGNAAVGDVAQPGGTVLTVIQLPDWDDSQDFT